MTDSRVPPRRFGLMSMSRDRVTTVTNSGQSARIETTHICTETLPPVGDTSSGKPPLDCIPKSAQILLTARSNKPETPRLSRVAVDGQAAVARRSPPLGSPQGGVACAPPPRGALWGRDFLQ